MQRFTFLMGCAALLINGASCAQSMDQKPPKLIVVISVDQFSADLFAEYRGEFTGGLKKLQNGAVFPSGYQSHAATETCPGHSTILTGDHPARTGIIANDWIDLSVAREDKTVYCAEDERVAGSTSSKYTVSDMHLKVPTLGERMKAVNPATRVISVAGKDRAAVMMGGHKVDELWWWDGKQFASYAGRAIPSAIAKTNSGATQTIATAQNPMPLPTFCQNHSRTVSTGADKTVGDGRFARGAGDARGFRASPAADAAVIGLAGDLVDDMKLGQGASTDLLAIGASATDYVGHTYGTSGSEMCIQLLALDKNLGTFFDRLDKKGLDYAVVLTADHGGHDLPERNREHGISKATRITGDLSIDAIDAAIARKMNIKSRVLYGSGADIWIDRNLSAKKRAQVRDIAITAYRNAALVDTVLTREEIMATAIPVTPPETWNLKERTRASFDPARSGDLYVILKPRVTPIADPTKGYVATHGSIWDYDRRVPILFWRQGMSRFEQPLSVETVDIAPTLAAMIKLPVAKGEMDGQCLDLDAGVGDMCT
jgi:predicted AlkP superfamily pyrophosphatase or phosphodiesterase